MALEIDPKKVTSVLMPDSRWHDVIGGSFELDAYDYVRADGTEAFKSGQEKGTIATTGATWKQGGGEWVYCPLTSVLAVSCAKR